MTLRNLANAGGTTQVGDDMVVITGQRNGKFYRKVVDLPSVYLGEKPEEDIVLLGGDTIFVHRAPVFYIYGEAQRPGAFRVERDMTVMQALTQGGGPTARGSEKKLRPHREAPDGSVQQSAPKLTDLVLPNADIDFALSKQFDYSYLSEQDTSRSPELVAACKPFSKVGENLRAVRSQLMLRWFNTDPSLKVIALVSPGVGEGRSFIAANLAIGVPGLPGLTVLPAGAVPPNPQELLGRPAFGALLRAAAEQFDVIIIDTPAGTDFADAEIIASRAGAAAIVTRKNKSLLPDATLLARRLQDSGVALVGSIVNDD